MASTDDAITAASELLGVALTEAERRQLPATLARHRDNAVARRGMAFPYDLAPAETFDPRLPGWMAPASEAWRPSLPDPLPLPESDADIAFAPMLTLAGWLRSGALTSERLVAIYLDRIARHDPVLRAFATVTADLAMAQARAADAAIARGAWRGPLHGVPYGCKDILDTAGIETAWGAEPFQGRVPATDATAVARMRAAGAVLLGKTSVGALAMGDVWYDGRTRTPWDTARGASGSSAGSCAAVAAGLCGFALGTETMGSIVEPSARCGTVGLRPTFGRVPRTGAMPLVSSLDKIGPIARSVADAAPILAALAGPDGIDGSVIDAPLGFDPSRGIAAVRVGFFPGDGTPDIGFDLVPLTRLDLPYDSLLALLDAECAAVFEQLTLTGADDRLTRQDEAAWPNQFRAARFLSAVDHVQLRRFRRQVMAVMAEWFETVEVIVGPAAHGPLQVISNFTGHPCIVVPVGVGPDGMPETVCVWGRLFDEGAVLRAALAIEHCAGFAARPNGFG